MGVRKVAVELSANVSGFVKGMHAAAMETYKLDESVSKLEQRKEALQTLGRVGLGIGAAVAAGTALAVKSFADFDAAMSSVQAATHATADDMGLLRDAALEAGERTAFSATEAAAGIEELSKAGVTTTDILNGGLNGALDLAAAGEISVGEAAETAASAMTQFGLAGDDVTHIADLLAAGAGKAQGGVSDLSGALNQSGLVASQMGLSIEETVGTLAEFASAGLIGSDAGTSFRAMLLRLANPTKEAAGQMEELGLNFYDAQGEFVGMEEVAAQLQERLGGLTQEQRNAALANIFGQDAIRSASILYEGGAESVEKWTNAVNDAGYAQETAATRLDNLKGDWESLTGSLETLFITMVEGANGPLRGLVQGLDDMVSRFGNLPDWLQQTAGGLTLAGGAIAGFGGAAVLALPKLAEFYHSLGAFGAEGAKMQGALKGVAGFLTGPWGVAIGGAITVIGLLANAQAEAEQRARSYAETLDEASGSVTDATTSMVADALTAERGFMGWSKSIADMADEADVDLGTVTDAILGNADAYAELEAAAARMTEETGTDRNWATSLKDAVDEQIGSLDRAKDLHGQVAEAVSGSTAETETATKATEANAEAIEAMSGKAQDAEKDITSLADTIRNFGSAELNVRDANRQLEAAFDDLSASVAENGATLDINTEAGRENEATLDEIATSTLELSAATLERTGSEEKANAVIDEGRQRLIEQLAQFGITGEAANKYADELGLIPAEVDTAAELHDDEATDAIAALKKKIADIPDGEFSVHADTSGARSEIEALVMEARAKSVSIAVNAITSALDTSDWNADGNVYAYADGGFGKFRGPDIYAGGENVHKFAEPETGWEAYISGKPSQRDRNRGIWMETGERLGMLGGGGSGPVYNISQSFNLPPGFTAQQVEQISARGVQSALR